MVKATQDFDSMQSINQDARIYEATHIGMPITVLRPMLHLLQLQIRWSVHCEMLLINFQSWRPSEIGQWYDCSIQRSGNVALWSLGEEQICVSEDTSSACFFGCHQEQSCPPIWKCAMSGKFIPRRTIYLIHLNVRSCLKAELRTTITPAWSDNTTFLRWVAMQTLHWVLRSDFRRHFHLARFWKCNVVAIHVIEVSFVHKQNVLMAQGNL